MISQKTLKLYVYVDGVNDVPFYGDVSGAYEEYILHNGELYETSDGFVFNVRHTNEQIEIGAFRYDAKRMGAAPTISFTLMYEDCLDNFWSENVYAMFNGEKYFLKQTPTSSLSNEDARYKHDVELISERVALDNVYFFDAVKNSTTNNDAVSNSATFSFFGDIVKFKDKLNESLRFANMQTVENGEVKGWEVIVDEGITSEEMFIPFDGVFFSNAIQESYNTFKIPYYFTGKEIHFGYTDNAIAKEFSYGIDDALLSITKTNANNKVVNRVTATGSSDNIPYYYPNSYPKGEIDLTVSGSLSESDIKIVNKESFQRLYVDEEYTYSGDPSLNTVSKRIDLPTLSQSCPFNNNVATVGKLYIEEFSEPIEAHFSFNFDSECDTEVELTWALENPNNPWLQMQGDLPHAEGKNQIEVVPTFINVKDANGKSLTVSSLETLTEDHSYYQELKRAHKKDPIYSATVSYKKRARGVRFSLQNRRGKIDVTLKLSFRKLGNFWSLVPQYAGGVTNETRPYSDIKFTSSIRMTTTGGWINGSGVKINMDDYGVKFLKNPTYGDSLKYNIVKYVTPSNVLLPPKYRESDGTERFYNATNGTYTDDNGVPIEFVNPYTEGHPREHIIKVEDIKPTIKEAVNTAGLRIDMFSEFAYDEGDNDQTYTDENGEVFFEHPYFFGKLRVMDFNLFDSANENQEMTISFTSGDCGACNFVIGATEDYPQMNPVQVYEEDRFIEGVGYFKAGSLKRSAKDGRVICGLEGVEGQAVTTFQDRQQDTSKYEVWIALRKEEETYGMLMPTKNIRPKACTSSTANDGDTFVITGINLPQAYITRAEEKLEREIIKYMVENNVEKFKFSIKFSRIYFEENPDVLELLNENSRIYIWYNGIRYTLYVNSISYYMESGGVLPDITVELDNELTLTQNAMQAAISQVRSEVGGALSNIDIATLGTPYFIRKDQDDEVQGRINFKKGIKFGEGGRVDLYDDNSAKLTIEYLEVTKKATFTSLEIQEKTHVGGQMLISPAAMNCGEVENILDEDGNTIAYRCYMQTKGQGGSEEIFNQFAVGDQAICQTFNAWGSKYYWRLVTAIGEDYIDLSVDDCDEGSDIPEAGDKIIQLGHRTDTTRQAAQVLSAHGETAPAFIMYNGINDYTLEGKEVTGILWNPATQEPQMYSYGNFFFGNREKDENGEFKKDFITFQPNPENPEEKKLFINADVQFGGGSKGLSDLSEWQDLQGEVDTAIKSATPLNLLANSAELVIADTYKIFGLPITVSTGDEFTFKAEKIELLAGTINAVAVRMLSPDLQTTYANNIVELGENKVWTFKITDAGVTNAKAVFLLYAGRVNNTTGKTIRYANFSLVKGSTPMPMWQDYQGDNGLKNLINVKSDETIILTNDYIAELTINSGEQYTFRADNISDSGSHIVGISDFETNWFTDTFSLVNGSNTYYVLTVKEGVSKQKAYLHIWPSTSGLITLTRPTLVKGTRPMMAWKENTDYLTNAFKNGTTKISGGLTMTQAVMVEDENGTVRGMLNGSNYAKDSTHGRLIVAAGSEGASTTQLAEATTRIYEDGHIESKSANIEGIINATEGYIGQARIQDGRIIIDLPEISGALRLSDYGLMVYGNKTMMTIGQCGGCILFANAISSAGFCPLPPDGSAIGVYSDAPTAAFMSQQGMFLGLRPYTRDVSSGETLTELDHTVYITGGTLYLPSAPPAGQYYRVYHYATTTLTIVSLGGRMLRRMRGSSITSESQFNSTNIEVIEIHNGGGNWYVTCQKYE